MADRLRGPRPRLRRLAPPVVLAVLLSACAGPQLPFEVGAREMPSSIVLNSVKAAKASVPLPPIDLGAVVPGTSALSTDTSGLQSPAPLADSGTGEGPTVPPAACPHADPFDAPRRAAATTMSVPPWPDQGYSFHTEGSIQTSGANASTVPLPLTGTRTVKNLRTAHPPYASQTEPSFAFDVVAVLGQTTTTTSYLLVPEKAMAGIPRTSSTPSPGLSIVSVVTDSPLGHRSFTPEPSLLLLRLPIGRGDTWDSTGTDPKTGETMAFTVTVAGGTEDVDACGTWLDTWRIHLNGNFGLKGTPADNAVPTPGGQGRDVSPASGEQALFTADYWLATAYGPLIVKDVVSERRSPAQGDTAVTTSASVIEREPRGACEVVIIEPFVSCRGEL